MRSNEANGTASAKTRTFCARIWAERRPMHTDVSGWVTRLDDEAIARYTRSGAWRGVTLADHAVREAERAPDRVAVIEGKRSITCGQVLSEAYRLVGAFGALGLRPGDVISFQLPNWIETVAIN